MLYFFTGSTTKVSNEAYLITSEEEDELDDEVFESPRRTLTIPLETITPTPTPKPIQEPAGAARSAPAATPSSTPVTASVGPQRRDDGHPTTEKTPSGAGATLTAKKCTFLEDMSGKVVNMHPRPKAMFHVGRNKYAVLSAYGGSLSLHLREYGTNPKNGRLYPTPRGIKLDEHVARSLSSTIDTLVEASSEARETGALPYIQHMAQSEAVLDKHLGSRVHASINMDFGPDIDIRQFWVPEDQDGEEEVATRKAIRLSYHEGMNLSWVLKNGLEDKWAAFKAVVRPCWDDHSEEGNQQAMLRCHRCNPSSFAEW